MLWLSLLVNLEVPNVMSLGMQTSLSELLVIIKGKTLLCNVALSMSVVWHFKFQLLSINAAQALIRQL